MSAALGTPYFLYTSAGQLRMIKGQVRYFDRLDEIPRPTREAPLVCASMIPYSQIRERGFLAHHRNERIISIIGEKIELVRPEEVFPEPAPKVSIVEGQLRPSCSAEHFAALVRDIIQKEIQNGEGSNFLLSRKLYARIRDFNNERALTILRHLIANEFGAYWNFCFFDGSKYFIGSSPERHLSYSGNEVLMNPICGTFPKSQLKSKQALLEFLADQKEINELFQVLDEELKMMAKICSQGGAIEGPFLKEMRSLIHTEYVLRGVSSMDKIDAFRTSMFAATMIGSPLENAARIIHKYETESRGYYSSAVMVLDLDDQGAERLDSAITIRTAEIDVEGNVVLQAGASIVRDSNPDKEAAEVNAKYEGVLKAIVQESFEPPVLAVKPDAEISSALQVRNRDLSEFWMNPQRSAMKRRQGEREIVIIDNEDEFTFMLNHILGQLGYRSRVVRNSGRKISVDERVLVILGPGPGNPTNLEDARIRCLHDLTRSMLGRKQPLLAVCLGHQVLSSVLGFPIMRTDPPLQGVQKEIELFGRPETVGFYNTFFAKLSAERLPDSVEVSCEKDGLINALRSDHYISFQFHPESVLTRNSGEILKAALQGILGHAKAVRKNVGGLSPV